MDCRRFIREVNVVCVWFCSSGEGTVYHLDEMTGALVISHTLVISSKDYPGMSYCINAMSDFII